MRRASLLLLLSLASCGGCEPLGGPEAKVASVLQRCSDAPASCPAGSGLVLHRVRFDRLLVKPEAGGYTAVSTVDAEGVFHGTVKVSYLGLERIPFTTSSRGIAPPPALLPALDEVAALLTARRDALAQRDLAALEALVSSKWSDARMDREAMLAAARERAERGEQLPQPSLWSVRGDRDGAEVLEEYPAGGGAQRSRFVLRREGGRLRFASGLL